MWISIDLYRTTSSDAISSFPGWLHTRQCHLELFEGFHTWLRTLHDLVLYGRMAESEALCWCGLPHRFLSSISVLSWLWTVARACVTKMFPISKFHLNTLIICLCRTVNLKGLNTHELLSQLGYRSGYYCTSAKIELLSIVFIPSTYA